MKVSLFVTAVIIAAFSWLAAQRHDAVTRASTLHSALAAQVRALKTVGTDLPMENPLSSAALQVETGDGVDHPSSEASLPREREDRSDPIPVRDWWTLKPAERLVIITMIWEKSGGSDQEGNLDVQRLWLHWNSELFELDSAQQKEVIEALRASPKISDAMKDTVCLGLLRFMADEEPGMALVFAFEGGGFKPDNFPDDRFISDTLGKWAEKDPSAALEWARGWQSNYPGKLSSSSRMAILPGVARKDVRLAFALLDELGLQELQYGSIYLIARGAGLPQNNMALIKAMRTYRATHLGREESEMALQHTFYPIARATMAQGFDRTIAWLKSAKLSREETLAFINFLDSKLVKKDRARWLGWISSHFPKGEAGATVDIFIRVWVREDYEEAGNWIKTQPAGPVKTKAILAYTSEVAAFEPAVSARWALTLTDGQERTLLLQQILEQWKTKDAAAAAAFAREQGLPED